MVNGHAAMKDLKKAVEFNYPAGKNWITNNYILGVMQMMPTGQSKLMLIWFVQMVKRCCSWLGRSNPSRK